MDEPLSNLDAKLRAQTRAELVELHRRTRRPPFVYVTHDQVEAMTMADRIAVLDDGRLQQVGDAARRLRPAGQPLRRPLHRQPADEHARRRHRVDGTDVARRASPAGRLPIRLRRPGLADGAPVVVGVRPEHLGIGARTAASRPGRHHRVAGPRAHVYCDVGGTSVIVRDREDGGDGREPATRSARCRRRPRPPSTSSTRRRPTGSSCHAAGPTMDRRGSARRARRPVPARRRRSSSRRSPSTRSGGSSGSGSTSRTAPAPGQR